jgi:ketosteroid isomerase-like protein
MRAALIAVALTLAAGPALADQGGAEVEAFMANYIKLWNADDAQAITTQIYRFDAPGNPLQTIEGFQKSYAGLKAAGYDHSDTHSIHGCILNRNTALAEMRFGRVKKDGTPYAPGSGTLVSVYLLHKTADGWRVGSMIGMDPSAKFECASYTPAP